MNINCKSLPFQKQISREKAAQIVERLCPSNAAVVKPKFVSMAEENKKFFGTPDRFRKKPRSSSVDANRVGGRKRSPSPIVKKAIFATMPQSPMLRTRGRTRCNQKNEEQDKAESTRYMKIILELYCKTFNFLEVDNSVETICIKQFYSFPQQSTICGV